MTTITARFFKNFITAINWNALFYFFYKICFVTVTFLLYKKLPSSYFSQWATANSFIFLLLLWLNGGLKKSIPRFAPAFSKNTAFHKKFITFLLCIKLIILSLGIPLLVYCLQRYLPGLLFLPLISILFVTEGFSSLLLLVYHAHFWQKQFNLVQGFFLVLEMSTNCFFLLYTTYPSLTIVSFLFTTKIIANCATSIIALLMLPALYKKTTVRSCNPLPTKTLITDFVKHSFFMWMISLVESLSERNFLFPFVSSIEGQVVGNLFKVIHDAAIFFQRIAIKTIGVADTALLSYIEVTDSRPSQTHAAFTTLFKVASGLCIPLLALGILFFFKNNAELSCAMTALFLIVACATTLEIILSPYIRVLEVKLRYKEIFLSYTPYFIGYALLLMLYFYQYISLVPFISCTFLLRIFGALLMVYFAKKTFDISLPFFFVGIVVFLTSSLMIILYYLI